jgi:hypothetical protein
MDDNVAYEMRAGDYHEVEIPVTVDGVETDLTGVEFVYVWSKTEGGEAIFTKTGTISSEGKAVVQIDPNDTATQEPGEFYHECKVRGGDKLPVTAEFEDKVTKMKLIMVKLLPSSAKFPD